MILDSYFKQTAKSKYILIIFVILFGFFLRAYDLSNQGYWMDEWNNLFWTNPQYNFTQSNEIFLWGELAPSPYLHVLKYFFYFFGYTTENGKLLSIILGTLCIPASMILSYQIKQTNLYLYSGFLVSLNIFLIWQSQEVRLASFALLMSLINISLFITIFNNKFTKKIFFVSFIYLLSMVLLLSTFPFTIAIIAAQAFYVLHRYLFIKQNKLWLLLIILISIILYLFLNYEYFFHSIKIDDHHATTDITFYVNYHFRTFFGSILLGAVYLLLILFLLIKFNKKIFRDNNLIFLIYIIFFSYFLPILYTLIKAPVMAPRYVIWLVPIIIIWIVHVIDNYQNKKLNSIFLIILSVVTLINTLIMLPNNPITKVPANKVLEIIANSNSQIFFTTKDADPFPARKDLNVVWGWGPKKDVFENYLSLHKKFIKNDMKIFDVKNIDKNDKIFWFVCLNNPRFQVGRDLSKTLKDELKCTNNEIKENWKLTEVIKIEDFILKKYMVIK